MAECRSNRISIPYRFALGAAVGLLGISLAAVLAAHGAPRPIDVAPASATPGLSVGIDTDTTATPANTPTSLGTIQSCREVAQNDIFPIDIYITDVSLLLAWSTQLVYNGSVVNLTGIDVQQFQAAQAGSNVLNLSEGLPDSDGNYLAGAADLAIPPPVDSGTGVLARVTVKAVGTGLSPLSLVIDQLTDTSGGDIGDSNGDGVYDGPLYNGWIAVNASCTLDSDADGVPDIEDNCPDDPNGPLGGPNNQLNTDADLAASGARLGRPVAVIPPLVGDALGDVCDPDDDNDSLGFGGGGLLFFRDELEDPAMIGTDPLLTCPTQGPPGSDPWPPNYNGASGDTAVNSGDLVLLAQVFNSVAPGPPYLARRDLNADGVINAGDLVILGKYFGMQCA